MREKNNLDLDAALSRWLARAPKIEPEQEQSPLSPEDLRIGVDLLSAVVKVAALARRGKQLIAAGNVSAREASSLADALELLVIRLERHSRLVSAFTKLFAKYSNLQLSAEELLDAIEGELLRLQIAVEVRSV